MELRTWHVASSQCIDEVSDRVGQLEDQIENLPRSFFTERTVYEDGHPRPGSAAGVLLGIWHLQATRMENVADDR